MACLPGKGKILYGLDNSNNNNNNIREPYTQDREKVVEENITEN